MTPRFRRYLLFQLPGWLLALVVLWGLRQWFDLSLFAAGVAFLLWIVKDFALYPLVQAAYEPDVKTGVAELVGLYGVVHQELAPRGQVRIRGELWQAEVAADAQPIAKGEQVCVVAARGLTLIVTATTPGFRQE